MGKFEFANGRRSRQNSTSQIFNWSAGGGVPGRCYSATGSASTGILLVHRTLDVMCQ